MVCLSSIRMLIITNCPQGQRKIERLRIGQAAHQDKKQESKPECPHRRDRKPPRLTVETAIETAQHTNANYSICVKLLYELIMCVPRLKISEGWDYVPY